jgi:hypothetical protein
VLPWLLLAPLRHYFHYLDLVKRLVKIRQMAPSERLDHVTRRDLQELQAALAVLKGMHDHMAASAQSLKCAPSPAALGLSLAGDPRRTVRDIVGPEAVERLACLGVPGERGVVHDGPMVQVKAAGKMAFLTRQKQKGGERLVRRHVYLVDGALLWCAADGKDGKAQCKGVIPAASLFPDDLPDTPFASNLLEWVTPAGKPVIMATASLDEKYAWMQRISLMLDMPAVERSLAELKKQRATLCDPALQLGATGYRYARATAPPPPRPQGSSRPPLQRKQAARCPQVRGG